jgi:hypothetical protein
MDKTTIAAVLFAVAAVVAAWGAIRTEAQRRIGAVEAAVALAAAGFWVTFQNTFGH